MILLPYENFYIKTKFKADEVEELLRQQASPGNGSFLSLFKNTSDTYFEGFAVNGIFELKRNINYRNSFLPQITGTIEQCPDGSRVHVKMTMWAFVTVFMCIWLGFALIAGFGLVFQAIGQGKLIPVDFAGFGMFLFGYALMMGAFKFESIKTRTCFLELLEGRIE